LGHFVEDHMEPGAAELSFADAYEGMGGVELLGDVKGHDRKLVVGPLKGEDQSHLVLVQSGREHPYEGISTRRATFWLRVAQLMGVKNLIGSNASGILTPDTLRLKDLMLLDGDIDLGGDNPLIGHNDEQLGPRFPHRGDYYPADARRSVRTVAQRLGIDLKEGTYVRVKGPNYESADDVRRFRREVSEMWKDGAVDGDERYFDGHKDLPKSPIATVGMSSTFENMVAQHASQSEAHKAFLRRAWISVATNYAALLGAPPSDSNEILDHGHVKAVAEQVRVEFGNLVKGTLLEFREADWDQHLRGPIANW